MCMNCVSCYDIQFTETYRHCRVVDNSEDDREGVRIQRCFLDVWVKQLPYGAITPHVQKTGAKHQVLIILSNELDYKVTAVDVKIQDLFWSIVAGK